ncbi:MAG: hypothetical protein A2Z11_01470 [Candidatus Woykebacteria bacterium RBG_16_43_9]|uniref:HTH cro/C1-type domain-containing protein n=1 Tax=Candidatus Woykebacteria bacterium RBG_16_43_9 TaxID=1802596 RepID=A0A1G1WGL0_9BACT|nr:MAG: hypothetical protein A2Z11_01470 [Candidatus Woykebacteria bacterium RBG_16_43_9]
MSDNPSKPSGLGATVRRLREEIGSQAWLAAAAEISQGYLSQIENDEVQNPSAAVIHRLAAALGVDSRLLMKAGGYEEVGEELVDESEFLILLELLRFLAKFSPEYQTVLYAFLRGFTKTVEETLGEKEGCPLESRRIKLVETQRSRKPENLGNAIRQFREIIGLTQGQLADSATVSQGYLSQLENGEVKNPSAAVLLRLAGALGVSPDYLFEAAGYLTSRRLRDVSCVLESKVLPRLREFLAGLPLNTQRLLLKYLQGIEDVVVSADKTKSPATNTEKATRST